MPNGTIHKVVHLSLQSANSSDASPASKGYGYLVADDDESNGQIYFEAKALQLYSFDDLQRGQKVEFDLDPKAPIAKSVTPLGEIAPPPPPQVESP